MSTLYVTLTIVLVFVSIALIALVLLQKGKGADAGAAFGAGASGTVFGARGSTNFLSRSTALLATVFFVVCLALAYLSADRSGPGSLLDDIEAPVVDEPSELPDPAAPESDVIIPDTATDELSVEIPEEPPAASTDEPVDEETGNN
ncbi:MAG: preprotein translocase subunit SecG [Pseudomonadota bacterium]